VTGLASMPQLRQDQIRHTRGFFLSAPTNVLALFFEGNDVTDNIFYLEHHFGPRPRRLSDEDRPAIADFIKKRANTNLPMQGLAYSYPFTKLTLNLILSLLFEPRNEEPQHPPIDLSKPRLATVIRGQQIVVNERQIEGSPPYDDDDLATAMIVYEESLRYARALYPLADLKVVYIPAVTAVYDWSAPQPPEPPSPPSTVDAGNAVDRSNRLCHLVEQAAARVGVSLIDPRQRLRTEAQDQKLYGPRDWGHFNQAGYRAFAEAIADGLSSGARYGCADIVKVSESSARN
jgi:hypothetical protein